MMKKNQRKDSQKTEGGKVLQIRYLPPDILRQLAIYEATHDMKHAEVFTKAFLLLLQSEA